MTPSGIKPDTQSEALLLRLATEARQTLHSVLGSIELVSEEQLSREQSGHLDRCRESIHSLLHLANDVSELVDFCEFGEKPSLFDFPALLDGFNALVGIRAGAKGLDLQCSVDPGVPRTVLGYRHAIETSLYRIVDNRLESIRAGGLTITVALKEIDGQFAKIAVEVSDRGPGHTREFLDDLRNPAAESLELGLGLQLARRQLEAIGGYLEVVYRDTRGSRLAMVVPVTVQAKESAPEDRSRGAALRLLVAEDSNDSFAVFETFVKDEGHQVKRAVNGAEAVEMFKCGSFDMVVMDVNMPQMDGYTATRAIREWETQRGLARLPILLLSADDASRQMRLGSAVGCSGYLTKPTAKQELLRALRHYTRESALPNYQ